MSFGHRFSYKTPVIKPEPDHYLRADDGSLLRVQEGALLSEDGTTIHEAASESATAPVTGFVASWLATGAFLLAVPLVFVFAGVAFLLLMLALPVIIAAIWAISRLILAPRTLGRK